MSLRIACLLSVLLNLGSAWGLENFYGIAYKKYDAKKKLSWNLTDWLSQKSSFRAQDHWLAMNRSVNFIELYLQASGVGYDLSEDSVPVLTQDLTTGAYKLGLFLSIFGIEGHFNDETTDLKSAEGQLSVMLFGQTLQGTNLVLYGGYASREEKRLGYAIDSPYWGGRMDFYIWSFLGLSGEHRTYIRSDINSTVFGEGTHSSYGGFVELGFLRILFKKYTDEWNWSALSVISNSKRQGQSIALQLLF